MLPASAGFLLGLVFNPEDGNDIFLKNVRLSLKYMLLQPRRLLSQIQHNELLFLKDI
jgi:hypothetical protein